MGVFLLANRRFQRNLFLPDLKNFADFGDRNVHAICDLLAGGLASEFLDESSRSAGNFVDDLDHMRGKADGPRLITDSAGDCLTNPPCRVGRKLVTAPI